MSYRPYPDPDRAMRQLDRHGRTVPPRRPSSMELRLAEQVRVVLTGVAEAARPIRESLVRAGAPADAPPAHQMLIALAPHYKAELARSAPGVLVMTEMARRMRRTN